MKLRTFAALGLLFVAAACAVNPATGRREFMLVSEGEEIQMGREADPQITAAYGLVDDPELQAYVSRIGQELAAVSERPDLPWSFKVVDDPIVNAFALPGGFIYVTRGILARFETEAELAGVLGHEIGHVTARHSASQMSRQQLQQIGLGVGMVVSETVRSYGGVAAAGLQMMNLSYSRSDESESDRLGLRYIGRVGYDADAMIGVFEMLGQASGGGDGRLPEWQSSHPLPENREAAIRQIIEETNAPRDGTVGREEYLSAIDGLVYGTNPRNGYFEGARFLHPDLAFQITFPTGWQTVNQTTVVAAIAPSEDAVVMLGLAPDATSPAAELRAFLSGEGVSGGPVTESSTNGIAMVRATFEATADGETLSGETAFFEYGGAIYRILGYAATSQWRQHAGLVGSTITSFAEVSDPAVLGVEPLRLRIVELAQAMSLSSFVQDNPQPIDIDELAQLNRTSPGAVLSAGTTIKTIVGEPVGR